MEAVLESAAVQQGVRCAEPSSVGPTPYPPAAPSSVGPTPYPPAAPSIGDVLDLLARVPVPADSAGMIEQIRGLEDLKSLAGARQADTAVAFDLSQRREQ